MSLCSSYAWREREGVEVSMTEHEQLIQGRQKLLSRRRRRELIQYLHGMPGWDERYGSWIGYRPVHGVPVTRCISPRPCAEALQV